MGLSVLLIAAGVALLAYSGNKLVDFAVELAVRARLTPAVIGLTVVAAGTSMPELLVSTTAALRGSSEIAVANVVGSNTANIGLILGTCSLLASLPVTGALLRFEYPVLLAASASLLLLGRDGRIDRLEGAGLLVAAVTFNLYSLVVARRAAAAGETWPSPPTPGPLPASLASALMGLAVAFGGLALGAHLLVLGAVDVARALGVSERLIGLTLVAVGTSLPELVASIAAALKRQVEMALTNIVGSNVFNSLLILGVTGVLRPVPVAPSILRIDVPVMLAMSVLLLLLVVWDRRLSRRGGLLLLAAYAGYMALLTLRP